MVNEVLELNSNSDLIFESQSLLALASGSGGINSCSRKKNHQRSEENQHHHHLNQQQERHFLDLDGNEDGDEDRDEQDEKRSPHDKLSWTFFEEVSTLDRHLRSQATTTERPVDSLQNDDENTAADVAALLSRRICSL